MMTEAEREAGIRATVRTAGLSRADAERWIESGHPLDAVRAQILDELAQDPRTIAQRQIIRAAERVLLTRMGLLSGLTKLAQSSPIEGVRRGLATLVDDRDHGVVPEDARLLDIASALIESRGTRTRGMVSSEIAMRAFTPIKRSAGYGGQVLVSDLAVVFQNTMGKIALGAYAQASPDWRRVAGVAFSPDFRNTNYCRSGGLDPLAAIGDGAEVPQMLLPDALKLTASGPEVHAGKMNISRAVVLGDDLAQIQTLAERAGAAAALSVEQAVFDTFNSGSGFGPDVTIGGVTAPLFDATAWGNVGTGAALSVAALDADRAQLAGLKDIHNGQVLGTRSHVLLVPMGLEGASNALNSARFENGSVSPTFTGGLFRDVVGSARLTGTRRWVLANPALMPVVQVMFLKSQGDVPQIEMRDAWAADGLEMRIIFPFRVQAMDPRGGVMSPGA